VWSTPQERVPLTRCGPSDRRPNIPFSPTVAQGSADKRYKGPGGCARVALRQTRAENLERVDNCSMLRGVIGRLGAQDAGDG
jgi:hypothetical protein